MRQEPPPPPVSAPWRSTHLIPSDDPSFTEADWLANTRPHFAGPIHIGKDGLRLPL